jgi:hypothetical protein
VVHAQFTGATLSRFRLMDVVIESCEFSIANGTGTRFFDCDLVAGSQRSQVSRRGGHRIIPGSPGASGY